jgi:hypothetical protein
MLNQLKAICESPNESDSTGLGITQQLFIALKLVINAINLRCVARGMQASTKEF